MYTHAFSSCFSERIVKLEINPVCKLNFRESILYKHGKSESDNDSKVTLIVNNIKNKRNILTLSLL